MRVLCACLLSLLLMSCANSGAYELEGNYTRQFENGLTDGSTYQSENKLTLIETPDGDLFFDTALEFYNGHQCNLSGIAVKQQDSNFLFTDADDTECRLKIGRRGQAIHFSDIGGHCREIYCGARGGLEGDFFTLEDRQPIRNKQTFLESDAFKEHMNEMRKH